MLRSTTPKIIPGILVLFSMLILSSCTALSQQFNPQPTERTTSTAGNGTQTIPSPAVPGVNPRQLVKTLEDQEQFTCTDIEINEQSIYEWRCKRQSPGVLFEINVFSRTKTELDLIDANVNQKENPSDEKAISLLNFVATLPQANSQAHDEATNWITETLPQITKVGDIRTENFGGIQYRLYGIADARSLELGSLP